jgi:hypothetical protein
MRSALASDVPVVTGKIRTWRTSTIWSAGEHLREGWSLLASPISSRAESLAYIVFFVLLMAAKFPRILLEGRFWAEEGNVFYEAASRSPWLDVLSLTHAGYLNFVANLAGLLAFHVPLRAAPYASTGVALLIQSIPAVLILASRTDWLQHRLIMVAALLLIVSPHDAGEAWLNSICSQYHLALAAALVLALDAAGGPIGALQLFVCLIAPLSGPSAWALAPLFMARSAIEGTPARILQTILLVIGVAVQLVFFFSSIPGRHIGIAPSLFGAIVYTKHLVDPFFLFARATAIMDSVASEFSEAGGPLRYLAVVIVLSTMLVCVFARRPRESPLWLFGAGAAIAAIGYIAALGNKAPLIGILNSGRYAFAAQALFALAVLSWATLRRGAGRILGGCIVVWLLAVGLTDYFPRSIWSVQSGPPWPAEVAKWRQDHRYALKIWPPGWNMTVP